MGLDCTAYNNVKLLPKDHERDTDSDEFWETTVHAYAYPEFERSTRGLADHDVLSEDGKWLVVRDYDITESESFDWRAGSYSGYSRFRASLSEIAGWSFDYENRANQQDLPFFELVWFADNEGTIGPEAAADLLADFQRYRDRYFATHGETESWWTDVYDDWIKALTLAADNGLISFH